MTIYLDVVFLENICMNGIILFATGLVTKAKCNFIKILMASVLGALYVVGKYLNNNEVYSNIFVQIGLSQVMIYIAFSPTNVKQSFKYLVIFYLTTFVFGGCAFALLYYIKPQEILYKNGILKGTYPIKIAILGGIVGLVIINVAFKLIKNRISKNDMFCNIKIGYQGKVTNVRAIIDSGNMLKEPITGFSVIVVERNKLEELLDKDVLDNLQEIISGNYENIDQEYISKFRLIPFSSLGKQNGMLLGFRPDWITVNFDETEKTLSKIIIRHIR